MATIDRLDTQPEALTAAGLPLASYPLSSASARGSDVAVMSKGSGQNCDGGPLPERPPDPPPNEAPPLGSIIYEITNPPIANRYALAGFRPVRYELLDAARGLLSSTDRTTHCSIFPVPGCAADVRSIPEQHAAYLGRIAVCGSVWVCPVCAARIMAIRRLELQEGMDRARLKGWGVSMATLTLRHALGDPLADLQAALVDTWTRTKRGAPWQRFKARHGLLFDVMALETPHGVNGWHPHRHVIFLQDHEPDLDELTDMQTYLAQRFYTMAAKVGRFVSRSYGVDVRGHDAAAAYLSKWGAAEELTQTDRKAGHGIAPFGLLARYRQGDRQAGALFREFAAAIKGRQQLRWSIGLREALGMTEWLTDQEAAELPEEVTSIVLAVLSAGDLWRVAIRRKLGDLLRVAAEGKASLVWSFLTHVCGIEHDAELEADLLVMNEARDAAAVGRRVRMLAHDKAEAARVLVPLADRMLWREADAAIVAGNYQEVNV